ncbi:hypothetical protein INT47_001315 [Mucor saturninus]|uniref:DNA mismatch repair protein S5 domain-containing protein n=1 Tax=Mucor saturninus TaxID=64648 RepID=A0A8H7QPY5_9FUNG|nr:hypothetical protein INT47_001315 [Mucor saturninus]
MSTIPSVKKLNQTVVNRIAAGEVIQRPANAVKELLENSIDAGSTRIEILVKEGGLKLLQIQDNGHGIRKEDMDIVCERFTTSKLASFSDLSSIATHGFRGEALASISHVAHVTITTKTNSSPCAYRALYADGKLVPAKPGQSPDPKPCAGNNGTQITAEDLFFNTPSRLKALKSPSNEYNRILDIVTRYAVHNSGISFTCIKQGAKSSDIQTSMDASRIDTIRRLYGAVASELLPIEKSFDDLGFKANGLISNANYNMKSMTLLLFINHRAVESSAIKRAIQTVYASLLPKDAHPFIYLSLEIDPKNVDVNVHPTKNEVHFLDQDRIINTLIDAFQTALEDANHSRTFYVQTTLPGASGPSEQDEEDKQVTGNKPVGNKPVAEYRYVRTDSTATTLDAFLKKPSNDDMDVDMDEGRVHVNLGSIHTLRKAIAKEENQDDTFALIQHEQNIYMVNYNVASEELFYQVIMGQFQNMGKIELNPTSIKELILIAITLEEAKGNLPNDIKSPDDIAESISELIISKRDMLKEYFSLEITDQGNLIVLPMVIRDYVPCMDKLPLLFLRLGTEVDWETEIGCFDSLSRELAMFYSLDAPLNKSNKDEYRWKVQHLVFPAFKTHFAAPIKLKPYVTQVANLTDLYKIFERC